MSKRELRKFLNSWWTRYRSATDYTGIAGPPETKMYSVCEAAVIYVLGRKSDHTASLVEIGNETPTYPGGRMGDCESLVKLGLVERLPGARRSYALTDAGKIVAAHLEADTVPCYPENCALTGEMINADGAV